MVSCIFTISFCNETPATGYYTYLHTLSLHDALPICRTGGLFGKPLQRRGQRLDRWRTIQLGLDLFKDRGELPSALATCGGQNLDGVTCQLEMVHHAEPSMGSGSGLHPLFACVGAHDQVTSEVSAVDG